MDRGHAHPAGLSGNAIPPAGSEGAGQSRGAEPGQERAALTGWQTWPWTTSLGGRGTEPHRAALAQKSELPGQRGPHRYTRSCQRGPHQDISSVPHPAISRVPAQPSAGSLPGMSAGCPPGHQQDRPGLDARSTGAERDPRARSPLVGEAAVKAPTSVLQDSLSAHTGAQRIPREAPPGFGADSRASGSRGAEQGLRGLETSLGVTG